MDFFYPGKSPPLWFRPLQSHRFGASHRQPSDKPAVLGGYLWGISPHGRLSPHTVHWASLFHHPGYFSRDTMEADSWSWVANYVRLSPFQAQLWSNGMKKQDQTARLGIILPFRSLLFLQLPFCLIRSLLLPPPPFLLTSPPSCLSRSLLLSIYTHFFWVSLTLPSLVYPETTEQEASVESLLLRKPRAWGCAPAVLGVPGERSQRGSSQKKKEGFEEDSRIFYMRKVVKNSTN